jgi:transcription initiation factor IIE alpha subunit
MEESELIETLKQEISKKQKSSENNCGTSIIYLMMKFNLNSDEIRKILKKLYDEKFINVRQGINEKLIFLK